MCLLFCHQMRITRLAFFPCFIRLPRPSHRHHPPSSTHSHHKRTTVPVAAESSTTAPQRRTPNLTEGGPYDKPRPSPSFPQHQPLPAMSSASLDDSDYPSPSNDNNSMSDYEPPAGNSHSHPLAHPSGAWKGHTNITASAMRTTNRKGWGKMDSFIFKLFRYVRRWVQWEEGAQY